MKKILLLSLCLLSVSCAHTPGIVQTVFTCAEAQASQIIASLSTVVADLLALPDYDAALSGLTVALGANGLAIVNCAVQKYLASPSAITQDAYDIARVHAGIWLQTHPVK